MNILIIEKDINVSLLFKEKLDFYNLKYKITKTGVEAYKVLFETTTKSQFDYIVTNIVLPDENGVEIIKYIKNKFTSKIIIYTGIKNYKSYKDNISQYDYFFIKKNFSPSYIIDMIVNNKLI